MDEAEPFWALLVARLSAAGGLAIVVLVIRARIEASAAEVPSLALIGLLDVGANGCFALGLSVVSVLASLYPVGTVVLARALLGERLVAVQAAGVVCALAGWR